MARIHIIITTYNRPDMFQYLLTELKHPNHDLDIFVYNDGSDKEYPKFTGINDYTFDNNNGRQGYWWVVQKAFSDITDADYYIMIPDDVVLCDDFFDRAISEWEDIIDKRKICLNLLVDESRRGKPCWTNFSPKIVNFNKTFYKTQWVDMCFICDKKFFNNVKITEINASRWARNKHLGSGVGQLISMQLYKNFNLYQVYNSLVYHGPHDSVMNKWRKLKLTT